MKILRCTPTYYDVVYSINPHMKPGEASPTKAQEQWKAIDEVYGKIGVEVEHIEGQPGLPDMVFSANQMLHFRFPDGRLGVIMANMVHPERRGEVPFFARWFEERGYNVFFLPDTVRFEGMGDVFYHADRSFLWGGWGFRTDKEAHELIAEITGLPVRSLHLVNSHFYHLDTCLCVLNEHTAMIYRDAFDDESYAKLKEVYSDLIEVSEQDAMNFVCNAHCPDRKHVLLQRGRVEVENHLRQRGFTPIPLETREFLKAGGSVTCLRLELE